MRGYNGAAGGGLIRRGVRAKPSVAGAAVDQCAPDALDFDGPLQLKDVVLACRRGFFLQSWFTRCDPALGYRIVPFADIDQVRVSSLRSPWS